MYADRKITCENIYATGVSCFQIYAIYYYFRNLKGGALETGCSNRDVKCKYLIGMLCLIFSMPCISGDTTFR